VHLPEWARRGRGAWRWNGSERPPFAETPGPGQESVWDFPRPPRMAAWSYEEPFPDFAELRGYLAPSGRGRRGFPDASANRQWV